jgi:hypothetical protein
MARVIDETRTFKRVSPDGTTKITEYKRIIPTIRETAMLSRSGYTPLASSNVSAAKQQGNDLYIRFWNSSVYRYPNQGRNFERLVGAASHGKWVWRFLRRPQVPYEKVGAMPLDQDLDITDEELFEDMTQIKVSNINQVTPQQLNIFNQKSVGLINVLAGQAINTDLVTALATSLIIM